MAAFKNIPIDKNLVRLYIVYGLPGSGKTTFLRKKFDFNKPERDFNYFNLDFYKDNKEKFPTIAHFFKKVLNRDYMSFGEEYNFVVDGFFQSPSLLVCFVSDLARYYSDCFFEVYVYAWNEDRDACLNNDERRIEDSSRKCPSADTIKNATFVPLTIGDLKCGDTERIRYISVEYQTVPRASAYEKFFNRTGSQNGDFLKSQEWCIGGTEYSYEGNSRPVYTEEAHDFVELDEFLERECPDISFLLYKKVKRECVTLEKRHSSDYYSSYDYNYWSCDLKKLYAILKDNGYFKD